MSLIFVMKKESSKTIFHIFHGKVECWGLIKINGLEGEFIFIFDYFKNKS